MFNKANFAVATIDDRKYRNCGVQISQEGTTATDGSILVRVGPLVSDIDVPFEPFSVDSKTFGDIGRSMNGGSCHVFAPGKLTCHTKIGEAHIEADDTKRFPNVAAVIPDASRTTFTIGFDPALLAKALLAFGKTPTVTFSFIDSDSCLRIDGKNAEGQDIMALVMPKRVK